ncbi:hypothetical protein C7E12_19555, partial [Stenotrophomonas maltophilia]
MPLARQRSRSSDLDTGAAAEQIGQETTLEGLVFQDQDALGHAGVSLAQGGERLAQAGDVDGFAEVALHATGQAAL